MMPLLRHLKANSFASNKQAKHARLGLFSRRRRRQEKKIEIPLVPVGGLPKTLPHTLVCKHASPASKLCSQDMRIACSARMCGRPAAALYPGLRPSAVRQCERGRPAAVHFPGRRRPAAVLHALLYRSLLTVRPLV